MKGILRRVHGKSRQQNDPPQREGNSMAILETDQKVAFGQQKMHQ